MSGLAVMFILIAALILAVVVGVFVFLSSRGSGQLNVERYQTKWLEIENSLNKQSEASWGYAVINGDKLLDQALKDSKAKGETMGERMKSSAKRWSRANDVWRAHKERNRIAHESDYHISYDDAKRSLAAFRRALKDLGAI